MKLFDRYIVKYLKNSINDTLKFSRWILLILFVAYLFSGIYSISQNEIGVLQRFGKVINDYVKPGIHYALPWPIDKINKVPIKMVNRVQIDDFYPSDNVNLPSNQFFQKTGLESYGISGDNNIVVINCVIQYTILKPVEYIFNLQQPKQVLYDIACNNILKCLSKMPVDEILTFGKLIIEEYIQNNTQMHLDKMNSGLQITFVELKEVNPPKEVQQYFNDVVNAKIDKRQIVNTAESYRNEKLPEAKGKANRLLQEAESYKNKVICEAEGETKRFLSKLETYQGTENINKKRLYLEFAKNVFSNLEEKYIIDQNDDQELIKLKIVK
jgi:membrane protease subunit HflK